jgi:hypothetical protein
MTRRGELALGTAVAVLGLLLLFIVIPREIRVVASETNEVSPAYFPRIVAWALVVLGVIHTSISAFSGAANAPDSPLGSWLTRHSRGMRTIATFAIGIAYLLLLPRIGYLAATTVAMSALILLFGSRPIWQAPAVALPFAWLVGRVFGDLLGTPLPRAGWLE